MKVNVFEGARRIGKAIALVIFVVEMQSAYSIYSYEHSNTKGVLEPISYFFTALTEALFYIGCFWFFCFIVGWIVRGFMGIAMGKDSKD